MAHKKRKLSRKTLKRISWIFRHELPFWGWYDCETDEIPVIIDNFVRQVWEAFSKESFKEFRKLIIREINHLILHEVLHYVTQPATEREEMDMFPKNPKLTVQENLLQIENKIDTAALFLSGLMRTKRIVCIDIWDNNPTLEELEEELDW